MPVTSDVVKKPQTHIVHSKATLGRISPILNQNLCLVWLVTNLHQSGTSPRQASTTS